MFTRGVRSDIFRFYRIKKSIMANLLRWQYGAEQPAPYTYAKFPGPSHASLAEQAEVLDNQKVIRIKLNSYCYRTQSAFSMPSKPRPTTLLMSMATEFLISIRTKL